MNITKNRNSNCIICASKTKELIDPQIKVSYAVCDRCSFIYKERDHHVLPEQEHSEYKNHNNSFESTGYVQMFERFIEKHIKPLSLSGDGLEYGSGPGPVLKELLSRIGFTMYDYDPFFNPNEDYKNRKYNLITSTEVVEHFTNPIKEFKHLASLLNDKGFLVIMTNFHQNDESIFLKWWYRRDYTHISFYTPKTFHVIAKICGLEVVNHNDKNVIVLRKYLSAKQSVPLF